MQILGYAVPFVGFRELPVTWDEDVALNDDGEFYWTGFSAHCLVLMWFGYGLVVYRGRIRRSLD